MNWGALRSGQTSVMSCLLVLSFPRRNTQVNCSSILPLHHLSDVLLRECVNPTNSTRMNLIMFYRGNHTQIKHRVGLSTRRCTSKVYSDKGGKRPPDPTWSVSWARSCDTITSILSWSPWAWLSMVFEKGIYPWLQKVKRQRIHHLLCTQWLITLTVRNLCLISVLNLASLPATSSWCAFLCYIKEPFSNWYLLPMKVLTCYNQAVFWSVW